MGPSAGLEVEPLDVDQADLVSCFVRGVDAECPRLRLRHDPGAYRTRLPDDVVAPLLRQGQGAVRHVLVQVDRGDVRAEVEADRGGGRRVDERAREEVLAVVLLHVVAPSLRVHAAAHGVRRERPAQHVEHLAPVLDHGHDRHAVQRARVPGLPAALGVEGGAVQDHGRAALVLVPGHDPRVELQEIGIVAMQPARHAGGAVTTEGPWPPRT
jgi:hypothetical protein